MRPVCLLPLLFAFGLPAQQDPFVTGFVEEHCHSCHGEDKVSGDLDLTRPPEGRIDTLWRWSRVRERIRSFEMPPVHVSEVTLEERQKVVAFVDQLLEREVPKLPADAGRVTVRRLSRSQWRNTVRDLLGVDVDVRSFPADDLGYGFDTIGDALTFSTLHLEKYLAAATEVAAEVFHGEDPEHPAQRVFAGGAMHLVDGRGATMRSRAHMYTNATVEQAVDLPRDGVYRLRIAAAGRQAGDEPARMRPAIDGRLLDVIDVANTSVRDFVVETRMTRGQHKIAVSFINDFYDPKHRDKNRRDRNLDVESVTIEGPIDARIVPDEVRWLEASATGRSDAVRLRSQIDALLPQLWRRPVTPAERQRLQRAGEQRLRQGATLLDAQRFVLAAALTSPNFLFRVERGASDAPLEGAALASRLSYFLWASAPDGRLRALARKGRLHEPDVLVAEVDRMLRDRRGESLAREFAGQWLELRSLATVRPDPDRYPFDDALRTSLARETELLFLAVLREGRDVRELLDADFTHVDARLATFYGLPHEGASDAFVRVALEGDARRRGGLLGHGSVLAVTSSPTRTSPVLRGKWILDNLLGQAPPPPPPGNDSFEDEAAIDGSATLRERMAQHRERSKCAVCHVRMDTLGLALERFDAIGRYRERDAAGVIDASGDLPDGRRLDGLVDLKRALAADPTFVRTVAHKLFVYAVGRDLRPVDRLRIDHAVHQLQQRDTVTLRDLILLVATDPAFLTRTP
jgi:hypothetical protein